MEEAKILKTASGNYLCVDASNIEMTVLGYFFGHDIGRSNWSSFKEWALSSMDGDTASSNSTHLERDMNDILLRDESPEEEIPTRLRITVKQFVQLYDGWQEKVVKQRPKEVLIKNDHGLFWIETSNESVKL